MGSTYDYTYEYEMTDTNKPHRTARSNTGNYTQRATNQQTNYATTFATSNRSSAMDPLMNLQHDRIWHKLYDPPDQHKGTYETEIQKMARRPDRKVIKIEAAYGSDRQTIIVRRNQDLRVRDVQEDASKIFKMPTNQIILYWKGKNICDTPNEYLEVLGVENNHQMRVCRADDYAQQHRRQELSSYTTSNQQYSSSNDIYRQEQFYPQYQFQQQPYLNHPPMFDQQQQPQMSPHTNYYQQLTNQNVPPSAAPSYLLSLYIDLGDRREHTIISRNYPITVYDLQVDLQKRFNVPVSEQDLWFNRTPLTRFPPDTTLDSFGIGNDSCISLGYRNLPPQQLPQIPMSNDYYSPRKPPPLQNEYNPERQQPSPSFHGDGPQSTRFGGIHDDMLPRQMNHMNSARDPIQYETDQEVVKVEVFHGSDRHLLLLRGKNNLCIKDLMEELENVTTVPIQNQKLYFRGMELQRIKDYKLRDAGIDNNAQIRLIGDPIKSRYQPMITGNRTN